LGAPEALSCLGRRKLRYGASIGGTMAVGCLTGNGKGSPVEGSYRLLRRGTDRELPPDLEGEERGRVSFREGILTDGDTSTSLGWKGTTLGEVGVDLVVELGGRYFLDRVVLEGTSGISLVEVYAGGLLVGRVGEREGPDLGERIDVDLGVEADEIVVHVLSCNRDLRLGEVEVWGASPGEPLLLPVPRRMVVEGGPPPEISEVVAGGDEDVVFAARLLTERFEEEFGRRPRLVEEGGEGSIVISKDPSVGPEGYRLEMGRRSVLAAPDRRGLVYGVESLVQLLRSGVRCSVEDGPAMDLRGVHLYMPGRKDLDFFKRLVRYLIVPMKFNTIFIQVTAGMEFERRPEINRAWEEANRRAAEGKAPPVPHGELGGGSYITKEEVREIVEYAKGYGLEVIPEVQSLSHVTYLTLAYPEIAEDKPEESVVSPYSHCYCPLHPESRRIVFDMVDEVVEVFEPRYVHMGHDEVYALGLCPRCRGKSRAELYAKDVNEIYFYLKGKGLGMMIWADMLQAFRSYSCPEAADLIPRDIILLDFVWYFKMDEDIEDVLLEKGFKVVMGNFYSSHYPRFPSRRRKVVGAEVSTWCGCNERSLGMKGKIYDFVYSANMMWWEGYRDELRWTMTRKVSEIMPHIRSGLRERRDVGEWLPIKLEGNSPMRGKEFDLSCVPRGKVEMRGVPFEIGDGLMAVEGGRKRWRVHPQREEVEVGLELDGLVFLHACSRNCFRGEVLGLYRINYGDGSSCEEEITYGWGILEWDRRYARPMTHVLYRHSGYIGTYPADPMWQGKDLEGRDVTLYGYVWENPHPERRITSVTLEASDSTDSAVLLLALTGMRVRGGRTRTPFS